MGLKVVVATAVSAAALAGSFCAATPAMAVAGITATMVNNTGHEMHIECRKPDSYSYVGIPAGQSRKITGAATTGTDIDCDVYAYGGGGEAKFGISLYNPAIGRPDVTVYTHKHSFSVGDTWNTSYNFVHVTVTRLADSGNKKFNMTFRL